MRSFRTLAVRVEAELEVRGSRFRAIAAPVRDREHAEAFAAAEARAQRNPSHVVPAFRLHDGTAYASDAGEPAGSAGASLLGVLAGAGLVDVAAVVARWFGGTKLGVGGLARAYAGALQKALEDAATTVVTPAIRVRVRYAHPQTGAVLRAVERAGGRNLDHGYGELAELTVLVPARAFDAFARELRDATRGSVLAEALGPAVLSA